MPFRKSKLDSWEASPAGRDLHALAERWHKAVAAREDAENRIRALLARGNVVGVGWPIMGKVLGISRSGARYQVRTRYSTKPPPVGRYGEENLGADGVLEALVEAKVGRGEAETRETEIEADMKALASKAAADGLTWAQIATAMGQNPRGYAARRRWLES